MKKMLTIGGVSPHAVKKALLFMKLTFLLILVATMQVSAKVNGQGRVSLNLRQVEISKALNSIEKQGVYRFLYNSRLNTIHKKINIDAKDLEIKDLLKGLFTGTDLTFKVLENNLIVVLSNSLATQDIKITGKITNEAGEGLPGVSISVKGSAIGTSTDNDGHFTLTVPEKARLLISYIGYETQEVAVNSQAVINVKLLAAKKIMDEVVVIGYGQASKRDLTGSIVKIEGKEVADKPNTNPIASLQSKVAGLYIVNNGTPGAQPDIRIRGTVSIGQVHPLYVVDGILNDNIDYINPNDIESIEVLKDPSSLAIFGVKGATGVIAITTKRAKAGQTVVTLNSNYGFKKLVDKIKMANASQFSTLFAEENANNNVATPDYSAINSNTDWISAVTRTAHFNANNLSISSSSEKNKFNMGVGYTHDEGIIRHEQLKKLLLSISDEVKVNKFLRVGVNLNASRQELPYDLTWVLDGARKIMPQVSALPKTFSYKNPYGLDTLTGPLYSTVDHALQNSGVENPLITIENEWPTKINREYRTVGSAWAEVSFLKNFTFRSTFYADMSELNDRQYIPLYNAYDPLRDSAYLISPRTSVTEYDNNWRKYQQDHLLNYKAIFGDHSLQVTGGFTTYYFGNFNRTGSAKQFTTGAATPIPNDPRFWYISTNYNDPTQTFATSSQSEYSTVSYLARVLYNYKGKYYLNASFRDDGSSQLPPKNRFQQFWAVGGAWEVTKENFLNDQHILDYLKIKGSLGVLGNQTSTYADGTPIPYPYYPQLNTGVVAIFNGTVYSAAQNSYVPNPNLKWETVASQEIGFEATGLQNRLHVEFNYFNKKTNHLMTYVSRPSTGLPDELINGGTLRNWGEELSASWNQAVNKDFSWNVSGNITFLNNVVVSMDKDLPTGFLSRAFQNNGSAESRTEAGHPIGSFYGFVVDGLYQSNLDILKSAPASAIGSYRPGDFKFRDVNHDGQIDYNDRTYIGNPSPKFIYGGSIGANYKGFALSIDIGGVYGNKIFRTWGSLESPFQRVNYPAFKMGRWHGAGTSNWDPIISQADRFNYNGSTYNIEDGSFIRLRNVNLSYTFNRLAGGAIKSMRVYLNAQNLKTWKHNYGYTAEFGGDATAFGYDNAGGAIPVVGTAGVNITF